jgi:hypothetical protein
MPRTRAAALLIVLALSTLAASIAVSAAEVSSPPVDEPSTSPSSRTLIDNDKIHASLVTLSAGSLRPAHLDHRGDQIRVYLDDSASHARGSVDWLPKEADGAPMRVTQAHRELYIELKHGTMSAADPEAMKLPPEPAAGGGAPTQVLLDNDQVRATLIAYPQDFIRPGGFRRRLDTLIVYIDDAKLELPGPAQRQYSVIRSLNHPDAIAVCDPIKDCDSVGPNGKWVNGSTLVTGTVAWHPKDGFVNKLRIAHAYRALYIELKH